MRRTAGTASSAAADEELKSMKKPLRELPSSHLNRFKTATKITTARKKNKKKEQRPLSAEDSSAMDRLLSVHSDLSNVLHQVDELVVQAFKAKTINKLAKKEIESFANVLSGFFSSLQPWVPRIQKVLSGSFSEPEDESTQSPATGTDTVVSTDAKHEDETPKPSGIDPLVSPSPLVSWRADADNVADGSKQLFMLSPLPKPEISITDGQAVHSAVVFEGNNEHTPAVAHSCFLNIRAVNGDSLQSQPIHPTPASYFDFSPDLPKIDYSMILSTPRLKVSPLKSCVLLEPEGQCPMKNFDMITPFSVNIRNLSESLKPGDASEKASEMMDYVGMNSTCLYGNGKKLPETSPVWVLSPPKTCTLMELPKEKSSHDVFLIGNNTVSFAPPHTDGGGAAKADGGISGSLANVESTPMLKDYDTFVGTSQQPGENTLKKELWTRFEALTAGVHAHFSHSQGTSSDKGFLDRLEEASSVVM